MNETVNIRPGVGVLGLFPAMNYKAWYALGELVDNALDSYLTHRKRLKQVEGSGFRLRIVITVESIDGGFIRVWDNAAGIDAANYHRAFVTADPPTDTAGLSEFGIGLKSASSWFAREWRVTSTALGESTKRTIDFDIPRIVKDQVDELIARSEAAARDTHYTEVRLWNLYRPPQAQTIGKMRRHLASMYRQFLRKGEVIIEFNGEWLTYEEPKLLKSPPWDAPGEPPVLWRKPIRFSLSTGEEVTGWAGLREKGSTKYAGFALFRKGRLIVGSDDETYRPSEIFLGSNSFRYQRLVGELSLDSFDVAHTKDAFVWKEREQEFIDKLKAALIVGGDLDLLRQADNYRAKEASKDFVDEATKAVGRTAVAIRSAQPLIAAQVGAAPSAEAATRFSSDGSVGQRVLELDVKGRVWRVTIDLTNDPAATEWLEITDRPSPGSDLRVLGIRLSLSHPFTQRYGGASAEDLEPMIRLGVGLAIAEVTARSAGVSRAGTVRRNLNELLLNVLCKP